MPFEFDRVYRVVFGLAVSLAMTFFAGPLQAQVDKLLEEAGVVGSVLDEAAPFDLITLKKEAGGRTVRVNPITDFADRKLPSSPKETDRFRVTFPLFPERNYEIFWKDIEAVYLYEQLLLLNANKLLDEKNFGEAFEHLNYLIDHFPQTPGLAKLRRDFLYRSAIEMATMRRLPHALAVLEQFQREFPDDKDRDRIRNAISNVASQLIESYFAENDLGTAKQMISRLENDYKKEPLPVVEKWKGKFLELAKDFMTQAAKAREANDFVKARQLAKRALEVDPQLHGAKEFVLELAKAFPIIRVGVFQKAVEPDPSALADWPSLRAGLLTARPLFEFRNTGPEGGLYRFSFGSFQHSDDRSELDLMIQNPGKDGTPDSLSISQALLNRALIGHASYAPSWAALIQSISVSGPERLKLKLRQPHVLPQAFLQWQMPAPNADQKYASFYAVESQTDHLTRYQWADAKAPADFQPREIHEVLYDDAPKAIADLLRGEIDVIDRLFPADARRLRNAKGIAIDEYALPMVHMLIPLASNPYLDSVEFRRAMLYAINREGILSGEILGGSENALSRVISGPFPYGANESDPIAYAYNTAIEPVVYDPRAAKILILLTQAKLRAIAEKRSQTLPPIPTMKLGVANHESARVAGEAIVQAWKLIGIPAELKVLDALPKPGEETSVDLVYASACMWEPATDAERLLGMGGPAESNNQFIVQALGKLSMARNWREVRQGCQDLHALVSVHLPILPLWQVSESFAYRTDVIGIAKKPVGLYQDVQKWRLQSK
jgi:tetratricopeptide (TPR) repeat protein